jgi:hypothetical protein
MNSATVRIFDENLRDADSVLGWLLGVNDTGESSLTGISDTSEEILIAVKCEFFAMSVEAMGNLLAPLSPNEVAVPIKDYFTSTHEAREATLTALQYSDISANFRKSTFLAKYGLNLLVKTLTSRELSL